MQRQILDSNLGPTQDQLIHGTNISLKRKGVELDNPTTKLSQCTII